MYFFVCFANFFNYVKSYMELKKLSKQTKKYVKASNTNMRGYKIGSIHIIKVIYKIKYTKKSCVGILECSLHKISFFIHRYFQRIFLKYEIL